MGEPRNHTQWNKPDRKKSTSIWFHFYKILENAIYSDRKQISGSLGPGLMEEGTVCQEAWKSFWE